jgi:predicted esterase
MTETRTIPAATHGRYLVHRPEPPGPHPLLVGFHGYGENAETHLEALRAIPGTEGWILCAIQALHRFYDRKAETVLGCWMTSQDRELAIADNVAYVRSVIEAVRQEVATNDTLVYAGFSQGVAMAYRAAAYAGLPAAGVIALAGDVPADVLATGMQGFPKLLIGTGEKDPWYTPERLAEDQAKLGRVSVKAATLVFAGAHEWTDSFRQAAGDLLTHSLQK